MAIKQSPHNHARNALFLQGPFNGFFAAFAAALKARGYDTHHICFNRGDQFYAGADHIIPYRDTPEKWGNYCRDYLVSQKIDVIILYGDSRHYHAVARSEAAQLGIPVLCLEEGYIRPGYITAEWGGNNKNSPIRLAETFDLAGRSDRPKAVQLDPGPTFLKRVLHAICYYHFRFYLGLGYLNYQHHRPGNGWGEMVHWIRSGWRKYTVASGDRAVLSALRAWKEAGKGRMFFSPLQVAVDSQILHHSQFDSVSDFISYLIGEFAQTANQHDILVFKHHPMDRGFHHYGQLLKAAAKKHGLEGRVFYCFDADLETLIDLSDGCVAVNSTVGLQVLQKGVPVKLLGPSFYEDFTASCDLQTFFSKPDHELVDVKAIEDFQAYLTRHALVGGDFFAAIDETCAALSDLVDRKLNAT